MKTDKAAVTWIIDLDELYCRLWVDNKISNLAVPIRETPHYDMASSFRAGNANTERYQAYLAQIPQQKNADGEPVHSVENYLANLNVWSKRFDLVSNPIEVSVKNRITFVVGGEHRVAFALASGYHRIPVQATDKDVQWGWDQDVQKQPPVKVL